METLREGPLDWHSYPAETVMSSNTLRPLGLPAAPLKGNRSGISPILDDDN
nr:MAG: hypothetical protein H1BulkLitter51939_000002 [Mitovirus sp.]QDH89730.1 MAG: hypothetical protein H1BulkLitter4864_000002 [Mitovirus sp.]QDH91234.1 MAG: hypothetical protein H2RhizoLitter7740_000002 [Mitovirus sp.]